MTDDAQTVARARAYAIRAHAGQRYGDGPYHVHLDAVADLLEPFGAMAQVIGYLHDVAEDTPVSIDEIRAEFGDLVARCVARVTDPPGDDRTARKAAAHEELAEVEGDERVALIVKAADRLANLRMSALSGNDQKLAMYRAEHPAFRAAAFRPNLCDGLWDAMGVILAAPG